MAGFQQPARLLALACLALLLAGCAGLARRPAFRAEQAQRVADRARALVGTPYLYGGLTPSGFDCSGFVCYVFREVAGIRLPHSSRRQFNALPAIRLGEEMPADLLFFSIKGEGPSHVGIYLGRGLFVHASDSGDTVKISDGNQDYWRKRLVGIRRVLE
jgi:cell wall-associated NlpC family hydrolase